MDESKGQHPAARVQNTLRFLRVLSVTCLLAAALADPAHCGQSGTDYTHLDLEDLMSIQVTSSSDIMGIHTHLEGEWMVAYHYMRMGMSTLKSGTKDLTEADVLKDFTVTPLWMTMDMHMVMVMYGVTDDLTGVVMLPYLYKKMQHINAAGVKFDTNSQGVGDLELSFDYTVLGKVDPNDRYARVPHKFMLKGGFSLPTGSIDVEDNTPAKKGGVLPYPMQLGSGTWDFMPGIAYLGDYGNWTSSFEIDAEIRLGKNSAKYKLGDVIRVAGMLNRKINDKFSGSVRLSHEVWGDVAGHDYRLNPTGAPTVPTKRPDLRAGERTDLFFGIDYFLRKEGGSPNDGWRFNVEYGFPIYEFISGPNLGTDWQVRCAGILVF